jgi:hypothetical protein
MAEGILMSFFNSRAKSPVSVGSLPDEDKSDPGLEGQGVSRLGKGTTITGTLWFGGSARIDGQVDGEITVTGTLVYRGDRRNNNSSDKSCLCNRSWQG